MRSNLKSALRRTAALALAGIALATAAACGGERLPPAPLDTRNETCRFCRMSVSDRRLAAQIVAPGEEPRFFDDLGCLSAYLKEHPLGSDAAVYLADHRTGEWVLGERAVYCRSARVSTPMGSGLLAHASTKSREQDPAASGGDSISVTVVLGRIRPIEETRP